MFIFHILLSHMKFILISRRNSACTLCIVPCISTFSVLHIGVVSDSVCPNTPRHSNTIYSKDNRLHCGNAIVPLYRLVDNLSWIIIAFHNRLYDVITYSESLYIFYKPIKWHNSIATILSIVLAINGIYTKSRNFCHRQL